MERKCAPRGVVKKRDAKKRGKRERERVHDKENDI